MNARSAIQEIVAILRLANYVQALIVVPMMVSVVELYSSSQCFKSEQKKSFLQISFLKFVWEFKFECGSTVCKKPTNDSMLLRKAIKN